MKTKNLPAKLLLTLGLIAGVGAMCTGTMLPLANAPALDPVRYAEADATRTAQAPQLYATETFNRDVLPTQQAVEAKEIVLTTENRYKWKRFVDQAVALAAIAWRIVVMVCAGSAIASVASLAFGVVVAVLAYCYERIKRARAYVPVQRMPDSAWYIPRERQLGDTRSGIGLLEVLPTAREHTEAVRQFRGVVFRSVVASFFDAVLRRKIRVNEWKPDSREIIVQ